MSLREIIRIKRAASCCTGQKEDICPSIKKSMDRVNRSGGAGLTGLGQGNIIGLEGKTP